MEQTCPFCNYDLQGLPLSTCPECGAGELQTVIERRATFCKTSKRSMYICTGILSIAVVVLMYFSVVIFNDITIALIITAFAVIPTCVLGFLVSLGRTAALRKAELLLWFRCSIWLQFPWLAMLVFSLLFRMFVTLQTAGMQPGPRVGQVFNGYHQLLGLLQLVLPAIALLVFMLQWAKLRNLGMLPKRNYIIPFVAAVVSIGCTWLSSVFVAFLIFAGGST